MQTVEELAYYFVNHLVRPSFGHEGRVKSALVSIPALINKGWTLDLIRQEVEQFAQYYPDAIRMVYHIGEIMDKKQPPNNLMEKDVFYYHNVLREVSPPVRIKKDEEGRLVRISTPFYLEMKSSFTMKDLLDYWYKAIGIETSDHVMRQDEGKFKYLLGNYTIDEVLFAIDVSKAMRRDRQQRMLRNAFELDKYMDDARDFIKAKINAHKLEGINREVRRHDSY